MAFETITQDFDALQRNTEALIRTGLPEILRLRELEIGPPAPPPNEVVIYCVDDGTGKTRLLAKFSDGPAQEIAIQP